jgi:hypothetical protein
MLMASCAEYAIGIAFLSNWRPSEDASQAGGRHTCENLFILVFSLQRLLLPLCPQAPQAPRCIARVMIGEAKGAMGAYYQVQMNGKMYAMMPMDSYDKLLQSCKAMQQC